MSRVIAVANQKGGVGKTTTTLTLGAALVERGRSVLLVDLDPQSSLTIALGVDGEEGNLHQVLGSTTPGVKSIRDIDISPGLFSDGPWGKKLVSVEGEDISLDDIEHRILRPVWKDPRVHYGVNCASIGCPNLQPEAFTAENSDELLDKGAREFVNSPRGARIENGKLTVSSIYVWFKSDFGGTDAGVIDHLKKYAQPGLRTQLEKIDRISDNQYDWTLNDATGN